MATVIRATDTAPGLLGSRRFELIDYVDQARSILDEARTAAASMIDQANANAEVMRREAEVTGHQEGFTRGFAEGLEKGVQEGRERAYGEALAERKAELDQLAKSLQGLFVGLRDVKHEFKVHATHDLLELAVAIGQRITRNVCRVDRSVAERTLTDVLRRITSAPNIVIRVHPFDRDLLRRFEEELHGQLGSGGVTALLEDVSVEPGGCRVSYDGLEIDAGIGTQLDEMARSLGVNSIPSVPETHDAKAVPAEPAPIVEPT